MMSPPQSPVAEDSSMEYRKVRALPTQLLEHTTAAFEEGLYADAFTLLSNTLSSGTGVDSIPALLPTAQHLAIAVTLTVHPSLTTRTNLSDRHAAADDALRYVKQVLQLVGVPGAGFDKAFQFKDRSTSSARSGRVRQQVDPPSAIARGITSTFAGKKALWTNAEDFWSVVGWAFNCSAMFLPRWQRWKLWLEFMLDVLEADLDQRIREEKLDDAPMGESLFSHYLATTKDSASRTSRRRIIRAIFADGSLASLASFPEIFKNETRPPKKKSDERMSTRKVVDVENGDFGDYDDRDSDSTSDSSINHSTSKRARRSRSAKSTDSPNPTSANSPSTSAATRSPLADFTALPLRLRLLTLLSTLCITSPTSLCGHPDLCALLTETLRPLPLHEFTPFLLPTAPYLVPIAAANLLQTLIRPIISAHAPTYPDEDPLTQAAFQKHFAPFAANGVKAVDHAKVAVCIEAMLRLLWREEGALVATSELLTAVQKGVDLRRLAIVEDEKGKFGVKGGRAGAREARVVAEACAQRMMVMMEMASSRDS